MEIGLQFRGEEHDAFFVEGCDKGGSTARGEAWRLNRLTKNEGYGGRQAGGHTSWWSMDRHHQVSTPSHPWAPRELTRQVSLKWQCYRSENCKFDGECCLGVHHRRNPIGMNVHYRRKPIGKSRPKAPLYWVGYQTSWFQSSVNQPKGDKFSFYVCRSAIP